MRRHRFWKPAAPGERRLICRFCDWSTPTWTRFKNGRNLSGFSRLKDHIEDKHPAAYLDIYGSKQEKDVIEWLQLTR